MQPHSARAKATYRLMANRYNNATILSRAAAIEAAEQTLIDAFAELEEELLEAQRQTAILLEAALGRK